MRNQSLWVRSRRRSIHALVSLALLAGPAWGVLGDDHPALARGYDRATAFAAGEVDDVNLFNGNLVVNLPIGQSYPGGGSLSYRLNLVYNSKVWDLIGKQDLIGPPVNGWQSRVHAMPTRHSNAGLGWSLGLGRLHAPDELDSSAELRDPQKYTYNESWLWLYVGADGGEHRFYPTLHFGDTDEPGDVSYTRDGSYLRMKRLADGRRQVELPDGAIHTFTGTGVLQSIADRFGNALRVTGSPASGTVTLEDDHGRQHHIRYHPAGSGIGAGQISEIDLAAFGGARAVYELSYVRTTVRRDRHNTYCGTSTGACAVTPHLGVDLLDGLELPDGSKYRFLYRDGSEHVATIGTAALKRLVFPTGGFTEWEYAMYTTAEIADPDPIVPDPTTWQAPSRSNSDGVSSRVVFPCGGAAFASCPRWTYEQEVSADRTAGVAHKVTRVTTPDKHVVETFFNVWAEAWDYGLPYSRLHHDGTTPRRYLSRKHLQWNDTHQRLDHVRSVFVRYESDSAQSFPSFILSDPRNMNQRMVSERVLYVDDGNKWADTTYANFDGLGNFRSTARNGNFGSGDRRDTFRQVQPAGRYEYDPEAPGFRAEHSFTPYPVASPWILGRASFEDVSDGTTTYRVETCHEAATGFLLRMRALKNGTAKSLHDVLVAYGNDTRGNLTAESYFGADTGAVPAELADCGIGAAAAAYRVAHTYQHGVRRTSETLGAGFKSLDLDLDASTGLAVTSRDATGFATGYDYDSLGRPVREKPGAGSPVGNGFDAWTEIVYTPAAAVADPASNTPPCRFDAANQCARVGVTRHTSGSGSAASEITEEELVFEALGRPWRELSRLPAGSGSAWSLVETVYDAMGRAVSVSEPAGASGRASAATGPVTRYQDFDAFGRARKIVPPDGAAHQMTYSFAGDRETTRTVKVWTSEGASSLGEQAVQHVERRDRLGRLRQVAEDVTMVGGQPSARVNTTYAYDPADRVISAHIAPRGSGSQQRSFFYDGRGFLLWEDHPETSTAPIAVESAIAGHDLQYGDYDALGNLGRSTDGESDLRYAYDVAGRLTGVSSVEEGASRLLKELVYTNQNAAGDWAKGKVRRASRFNYVEIGGVDRTVRIDYLHTYGGRGGRLSDRALEVQLDGAPATERFVQSWRWDDLGNVEHLDYPQCAFAACTGNEGTLFTDVAASDPARPSIEALVHAGVTGGCGAGLYCPSQSLTRAQAAVFFLASIEGPGYQPPACGAPMFGDVPCSNPLAAWVNEFARRGFTSGCGGGNFCPNITLIREQIAVFLLASSEGPGYAPPSCSSPQFADVPCSSFFARWIYEAVRRGYMAGCTGSQFCPQSQVTRRDIAMYLVAAFEMPVVDNPSHPRRVRYAYDRGALVGVGGFARFAYHPSQLLKTVDHLGSGGAVASTWSLSLDAGIARPGTITVSAGAATRTFGPYRYDGTGNVRAIGGDAYEYDRLGRLTKATLSGNRWQSYAYDGFGNLVGTSSNLPGYGRSIPVSASTNRLTGALTTKYDGAGNLTSWNGQVYDFDALHRMTHVDTGSEAWMYLYDAADERVWKLADGANPRHDVWTLRDLDGSVLRTYDAVGFDKWTIVDDFVHADGRLLAASNPKREALGGATAGARRYHLDHLGTPRVVTVGSVISDYEYFPYGEELTAPSGNDPLRFTGHERDLGDPTSHADDLDAMHARFYNPQLGRFLSIDPIVGQAATSNFWSRYAYTASNPMRWSDPTGEVVDLGCLTTEQRGILIRDINEFTGHTYGVDENNHLVLLQAGDQGSATARAFLDTMIGSQTSYSVVDTKGSSQGDYNQGSMIAINFDQNASAQHGAVDPRTLNSGSTFIHELYHHLSRTPDQFSESDRSVKMNDFSWTGPVVDFVNEIRLERGFPRRAAYMADDAGPLGGRQALLFKDVDPKRPNKLYRVVRDRPAQKR